MTSPETPVPAPEKQEAENDGLESIWETQFEVCDICYHHAYYVVTMATGKLFFCSHHFHKNKDALLEVSEDILDESAMLTAR